MAEDSSKRKGIIVLAAIVVIGGGAVWWANSGGSSEQIPEDVADKANRLTQQAAEAEDQRTADQVDMPEEDTSGITDMRGGDG